MTRAQWEASVREIAANIERHQALVKSIDCKVWHEMTRRTGSAIWRDVWHWSATIWLDGGDSIDALRNSPEEQLEALRFAVVEALGTVKVKVVRTNEEQLAASEMDSSRS